MERDLIITSPCEGFRAPPRPKARERVLTDDELRLAWHGSDRLSGLFGPLVKLLILTGQRRAEVAGMTWAELDLDAAVWRMTGDRTKNGRAHEVDLSDQALAVIEDIPRTGTFLFPARGEGAARGFSATKRQLNRRVREVNEDAAEDAADATELGDSPRRGGSTTSAVPPRQVWPRLGSHLMWWSGCSTTSPAVRVASSACTRGTSTGRRGRPLYPPGARTWKRSSAASPRLRT